MSADTATTIAPRPAPDEDAVAFANAMDVFARAWRHARMRLKAEEGLSVAQFHLLEPLLTASGPLSVGALAAHAGVAAPTATRMLDALVRDGLCERTRDDGDRRCVKVTLTPGGRLAADRRLAQLAHYRERMLLSLSPDDRRDAARLLTELAAAIEDLQ